VQPRDPLPHWKPVKGPEQRAGVGASSTLADDPDKVVLDALEFVESSLRCAAQKGVAVVKSCTDNIPRHRLSDIVGERTTHVAKGADMEIAYDRATFLAWLSNRRRESMMTPRELSCSTG